MNITATRPLRQIFDYDQDYASFDDRHGFDFNDFELPEPPDRPDPTLWRRSRAEAARRLALVVLHSNHVPGFAYDAILPTAQRYQVGM